MNSAILLEEDGIRVLTFYQMDYAGKARLKRCSTIKSQVEVRVSEMRTSEGEKVNLAKRLTLKRSGPSVRGTRILSEPSTPNYFKFQIFFPEKDYRKDR